MTEQASFSLKGRNPDILSCIANLSNDEVFTPPELANKMLDAVAEAWATDTGGANLFANKDVKFLDPFTKSGVFLREVTRRLTIGLEDEIPDLQERVDHILTQQVYGVGITHLTSLLARRSVYCSKTANGEHSIASSFESESGNIWFERIEHTWENSKCIYCGATQGTLDRGLDLESHAYALIHNDNVTAFINSTFGDEMQFDVIIGNPPYQLSTEGHGNQARPIYNKFVEQAKQLEPRYLSMIIPSRWFSGGMGLGEFRETMLQDDRLRTINDYLTASDVFPGVGLKGGVCYFLWNRDNAGLCKVNTYYKDENPSTALRPLLETGADIFIRFNEGLSILKKVANVEIDGSSTVELPEDKKFINLVSSIGAYGLDTKFRGKQKQDDGDLKVYRSGGIGFVERSKISKEAHSFDRWKVFVGAAAPGTGNKDTYPHKILSTPFIGEPGSISSWTYNYIGPFESRSEAESVASYLACKLTRMLILLHKPSQHTNKQVYTFVPVQPWDRIWTDDMLFEKYGLTDEEINFIDKIVRPMELK